MAGSATAVVLVLPEDGADAVIAKLRASGATSVNLLVSEGAVAMRRPEVAARIQDLAIAEGLELLLISSDPATVEAAQRGGMATMLVDDARVLAPGRSNRTDLPASPYSTRVIERRPAPPGPPPPPARPPASPDDPDQYALEGIAAALDAPTPPARPALSDAELLAASLDTEVAPAPPPPRPAPARPVPRREATAPLPRAPAAPLAPRPVPVESTLPRGPVYDEAAPRRRGFPIFAAILALLLLLLAAGAAYLYLGRTTVTVAAPVRPDTVEPFSGLILPLAAPGSGAGDTAVVAEALSTDVAATQSGEVTESTLTPSSSASGVVSLLNSSAQSIVLPAGTEFIAVKADGQEVPFVSSVDVTVPGATTSDQGAQIVTTRGQAEVPVTARSPGSASNVDANTVRRIAPPGGQSFNTDTGSLRVSNPPIGGGSEQEVRVVKDADVQALLAPALEQLDAEARRQLEGLAQARGLAIEPSTVDPSRAELEQLRGFESRVEPPVSSTLDPANPRFTLTVQAPYTALAIDTSRPFNEMLGAAVTEQLRRSGELQPGDCRAPFVLGWRWDGQSLLADGEVRPDTRSPGCSGGLDDAARAQVRAAVLGKSRAEAEAALQALVDQGLIGSYSLPENVTGMPIFDWQLTIQGE